MACEARRMRAWIRASSSAKGEGFGQVIIGAGLQTADTVVHSGLGAQDDDRGLNFLLAETSDEAEPVQLGEHDVDDGGVIVDGAGERQASSSPSGAGVDGIAILLQAIGHERGDLGVVFNDQDAHVRRGIGRIRTAA
jgi:hypothetical protein